MSNPINRRAFLAGIGATAVWAAGTRAAEPAGEPIRMGVMGCGGRGAGVAGALAAIAGIQVTHVCDVDDFNLKNGVMAVEKRSNVAPAAVKDFRRILNDEKVEALVVTAPDHWHAPAAILACKAGKHVYVEKPCCHNPREGELMVEAARKNNRVVQVGTQRRSYSRVIEAIGKLREGIIGKVHLSRGWYMADRKGIGRGKRVEVPARLDWDLWQGPAPAQAFRDNITPYNWHWFWHWGTGELGNNGIHSLDLCRWGLGVDYPSRVSAGGGRYHFEDDQETPDTMVVSWDFGDKMITWEGRSCQPRGFEGSSFGIGFYGDEGTLVIGNNDYKVFDRGNKEMLSVSDPQGDRPHFQNFVDCIRSGKRPAADVEDGHKSTLLCHIGNIAWRTRSTLKIDPKNGHIIGNDEAGKLWGREYREGWAERLAM